MSRIQNPRSFVPEELDGQHLCSELRNVAVVAILVSKTTAHPPVARKDTVPERHFDLVVGL